MGASLTPASTVMVTSSGAESAPEASVTTRRKTSAASALNCAGARKPGAADAASLKDTAAPLTWLQAKLNASPSGSVPEPSRDTASPSATVWSAPASAAGASFTAATAMVTRAASL